MQSWQLPEYIADILPSAARQLESAKEQLLALYRVHGYELVSPPLLEYSQSLLTRIDEGLSLKTIRVVDQLSGRQLGLRADITPQVARIDAHLLSANSGINRLCYAGPVLHARPDGFLSTREPLQIGAELYGYAGIEADIELIDLMLKSLAIVKVPKPTLSLGHIGIFHTLANAASLTTQQAATLLQLMQAKDAAAVQQCVQQWQLSEQWIKAFVALPALYGTQTVLQTAADCLPDLPEISEALQQLRQICTAFANHNIFIDLSELRVDNYHTGLLFAAYSEDWPDALARGGRYNGLGKYFGRNRPASGFSFDLRDLIGHLPPVEKLRGIKVSVQDASAAKTEIEQLRSAGECVIIDYTPECNDIRGCDRQLVWQNQQWQLIPL
ncbi:MULTISPECIES: ATP phosphoribosyltransferase regulatory subunit [unclassified Snodgrassella]|uniref:ATP phosphoribosyltransferase regulatory subunit n=1 Tax=unclassified Snodgrassella TaxID=2625236 RepID=UPI0015814746|nr:MULTISPECIES: ATP phosphoribosyltransferase regulatory subunit [unclassified Snodgrassella]MBI0129697.1 ATP phosphoribosyltransferase regulatory subunit [Snodgrassella sp. W8124]NUE80389.1 ATP phosphoribosyltransferase regulatory subunit [Snodgrassella sp. ESL0304]